MSKKLFVGGLSWDTGEEDLRNLFSKYGEITEVRIITDRDSGRSRGFGFVEFVDAAAADKAIAELNETELDGRTIKVNEARDRKPQGGGPRGRSRDRW